MRPKLDQNLGQERRLTRKRPTAQNPCRGYPRSPRGRGDYSSINI